MARSLHIPPGLENPRWSRNRTKLDWIVMAKLKIETDQHRVCQSVKSAISAFVYLSQHRCNNV